MTADDLGRRAIIAAHDAECGDRHCEYVHMPSLSKREKAIVEKWRIDRNVALEATAAVLRVRDVLRAIIDAPPPDYPQPCEDADDGYCHHDAAKTAALRIAKALNGTEATDGTR